MPGSTRVKVVATRAGTRVQATRACARRARRRSPGRGRRPARRRRSGEERFEDVGHGLALDAEAGVRDREVDFPVYARGADADRRCPAECGRSALSMRMRRTCATRSGSHSTSTGCRRSAVTADSCSASAGVNSAATSRASAARSVGSGAQLPAAPDPRRERSSSSVVSLRSRSTCPRICATNVPPCLLVELLVGQQLEEAAQREDRRAQLVRRGGDELLARRPAAPRAGAACRRRPRRAGRARRRSPPRCGVEKSPPRPGARPARGAARARSAPARRGSRRARASTRRGPPRAGSGRRMKATLLCTASRSSEKTATFATVAAESSGMATSATRPRPVGSVPVTVRPGRAAASSASTKRRRRTPTGRCGVQRDGQPLPLRPRGDVEDRHPRARARAARLDPLLDHVRRARRGRRSPAAGRRGRAPPPPAPSSFCCAQLPLERRHDGQVDDRDGAEHDQPEQQRRGGCAATG